MGGGQRTESTTNISSPYVGLPDWAAQYYRDDMALAQGAIGSTTDIRNFLAENPRAIEGISEEEYAALDSLLEAEGASLDQLTRAEDMIGGEQFMSGYTDDVVDTTLSGIQRQADRERAGRGASEASIGGITNTRSAVADMLAGESTARTMAETEAQLRDQAHRFGVEAGFQGAGTLRDLAGAGFDISRGASGAQGALGALGREQRQQQSDEVRTAGQQAQSWWTDVFSSQRQTPATGATSSSTTRTTPGPSPLSQIMGTAATAAGIWAQLGSDERIKENIELSEGALDKLRMIPGYEYNYRPDYDGKWVPPGRTSGLMAQDIEQAGIEGAVSEMDGVKVVNPYPVLATVVQAVRELDARTRNGMEGL
jgi:hypothetical protein